MHKWGLYKPREIAANLRWIYTPAVSAKRSSRAVASASKDVALFLQKTVFFQKARACFLVPSTYVHRTCTHTTYANTLYNHAGCGSPEGGGVGLVTQRSVCPVLTFLGNRQELRGGDAMVHRVFCYTYRK